MATELSMNGRKKIETIQKEFTSKFPYLTLVFLDVKRQAIDISKSLSEVRKVKGDDISIIGSLKVNTLEKRFLDNFGIIVEVAYQKQGNLILTKDNVDQTLNELNKWCDQNKCEKFEFTKSLKGNTLLSVQDQLFYAVKEVYANAESKKINKDNYLDIYIPEVSKKRGNHLYFNVDKSGIKIGFYCRDTDFINQISASSTLLEQYSQGLRLKNNSSYSEFNAAVEAAMNLINLINVDIEPSNKSVIVEQVKSVNEELQLPVIVMKNSEKIPQKVPDKITDKNEALKHFLKLDLNIIPNPDIALELCKNGKLIEDLIYFVKKYNNPHIVLDWITDEIDDLNLSLFLGQIKLGQHKKYFELYFEKIKLTNKTVNKDGEKIELTCYAQSNKMDKEIIVLVAKFEKEKLVSFEDRREKSEGGVASYNSKSILNGLLMGSDKVLETIYSKNIYQELDPKSLYGFLKSIYPDNVIFNELVKFKVEKSIKYDDLIKLFYLAYPNEKFIPQLIKLDSTLIEYLSPNKIINCFIFNLEKTVKEIKENYNKIIDKGIYFANDGSSTLTSEIITGGLIENKAIKNKIRLFEIESKHQSYYSINEIIDQLIHLLNDYFTQIKNLKNIGFDETEIKLFKQKINIQTTILEEIKSKSSNNCQKNLNNNRKTNKNLFLSKLFFFIVLAVVIWFLMTFVF